MDPCDGLAFEVPGWHAKDEAMADATGPKEAFGQITGLGVKWEKWSKRRKSLPYGQPVGRVREVFELPAQGRNGHRLGLDAQKRYFIAKTEEFLEHLRLHEFVGREEYEGQIRQALQDLKRSPTSGESERIMNEICLKVTIACYAIKAYERVRKGRKP